MMITAALGIALMTAACGATSAAAPSGTFAPPVAAAPASAERTGSPTDEPEVLSAAPAQGLMADSGPSGPAVPAAAAAPAAAAIQIANFAFAPSPVTIQVGGRVTWTNTDGERHSILLGGSESPRLDQNGTYSQAFSAPGRFSYVCGIHSSMKGVVVVVAAGSAGATAAEPDPAAGPTASPAAGSDDHADDNDDEVGGDDHSGHGGGDDSDDGGDDDHSGPGGGGSGHG
jgi:plastocyanin